MMGAFINPKTGYIDQLVTAPDKEDFERHLGHQPKGTILRYITEEEQKWITTDYYLVNNVFKPRPLMDNLLDEYPATAGQPIKIENIPKGATVGHIMGENVVNDGEIEVVFHASGKYYFTVSLFPYVTEGFTIEVI